MIVIYGEWLSKYQNRCISGIVCFLNFMRVVMQKLLPKTFAISFRVNYTFLNPKGCVLKINSNNFDVSDSYRRENPKVLDNDLSRAEV